MRNEREDPVSDRELADRIVATGDEAAFRLLYRRHTPRLWPTVLRILGGTDAESEAEDVIQETWIRAVSNLSRFRWEAAFRTWVTGIAVNRCREALRKRGRRRETSTELLPPGAVGGSTRPDPGRRMDLEQAIRALPDGYRTVLVLHDLEGFTHPEIAERLEIAVGTSRSQLHHARRAVRQHLSAG
ncbi:MAG: sigma-70 family RNA polymerase sigma factor [Gemmatimonadota bacterium]|jgi:RNA polymerase sigma-70 factor (ECF subfamily)